MPSSSSSQTRPGCSIVSQFSANHSAEPSGSCAQRCSVLASESSGSGSGSGGAYERSRHRCPSSRWQRQLPESAVSPSCRQYIVVHDCGPPALIGMRTRVFGPLGVSMQKATCPAEPCVSSPCAAASAASATPTRHADVGRTITSPLSQWGLAGAPAIPAARALAGGALAQVPPPQLAAAAPREGSGVGLFAKLSRWPDRRRRPVESCSASGSHSPVALHIAYLPRAAPTRTIPAVERAHSSTAALHDVGRGAPRAVQSGCVWQSESTRVGLGSCFSGPNTWIGTACKAGRGRGFPS